MLKNALLIFAKYPEPGKVKTRLCPDLTYEQACKLYKAMTDDIIKNHAGNHQYDVYLCCDPPGSADYFRSVVPDDMLIMIQSSGNMGNRLRHAFSESFTLGFNHVAVIGSDCLDISDNDVGQCFELLEDNKVVLGPFQDGRHWLIGTSDFSPEHFKKIPWNTEVEFKEICRILDSNGVPYAVLKEKYNLNTYDDILRFRSDIDEGRTTVKATSSIRIIDKLMQEKQKITT